MIHTRGKSGLWNKGTVGIVTFVTFVASALCSAQPAYADNTTNNSPSIFARYTANADEIIQQLGALQGQPLDPASPAARWLDEMGWRKWVREFANKPFVLTDEMKNQLTAQDAHLRASFSYQVGDVVWVPAEAGEQPYGHRGAKINPRAQIKEIIQGESETLFVVEVGVDNGPKGGIHTIQGQYYDKRVGPVLDYHPSFDIQKKTYVYSAAEIQRYNAPFRSEVTGNAMGTRVDYASDSKWLAKLDAFKNAVVEQGLEIDFTASPKEVLRQQRRFMLEIFRKFKMNRNAPRGSGTLGALASGGGECFTQACVLTHAVHAVGEPVGIGAINISGQVINPDGGHGFARIMMKGPEETHVYDLVKNLTTGDVQFKGMAITSRSIEYISDPGWEDYATTKDKFAMTPIEKAINPLPTDANRAILDLERGVSMEEVAARHGATNPFARATQSLRAELFADSNVAEFLSPSTRQLAKVAALESEIGAKAQELIADARALGAEANARALKTRILTEVVDRRLSEIQAGGRSAAELRILLTEVVFRALRH